MNSKRSLAVAMVIALTATLFVVAGLYAGTKVEDEFEMNTPYEHKKLKTKFTHKKHIVDYKIGCGDCHHDEEGKPLNDLKEGDDVQKCFECHKKPGELKGKKAKGLTKAQKREYHANAVHDNCIGCHRKFNKELKKKAKATGKAMGVKAPTKCTACHPKPKK